MYTKQLFELSMVLDNERFQKALNRAYKKAGYLDGDNEEYIDQSVVSKGITVMFRDSQYKKKVKLLIDWGRIAGSNEKDSDRLIQKLHKRIGEYFDFRYGMEDFILSGMALMADIDVYSRENVSAYLKVLKRIGRVKGFSQSDYDCFENVDSFCLDGNSNHINFWLYDLEGLLTDQLENDETDQKHLKLFRKDVKGIIRAEVRLTKPSAVREYTDTDAYDVSGQIAELSEKSRDIFLDVFTQIIPYGDYYKKDKAEELVCRNVGDDILRRRMLRLLALIPEKKSLYLAQKAMNCRNVEKVMEGFAKINLSPVTISKRHDVKYLECLYTYFLDEE